MRTGSVNELTTEELCALEYDECAADFFYWLAHYGWMRDEEGEVPGPGITLWPDQREYLERYRAGEWLICGKSRRVGLSWLATLADLHDLMFCSNVGLGVIAQNDFWAKFHLGRLTWVYDQQPEYLKRAKPVKGKDNKHEFGLTNGSSYSAYPCTPSQARGAGGKRIRLEELAFFEVDAELVLAAVYGATRDRGQVVVISTGNGEGGPFHRLWNASALGQSRFTPIFLSWRARPDRPDNFRDGMSALERQEFPETPSEMFLGTGFKFFDLELLSHLEREYTREPLRQWNEAGVEWTMYVEPQPGRVYVAGGDPADGGGDGCSADFVDLETGEQVLHLHSYIVQAEQFADHVYQAALQYNRAYLVIERNNMGSAVLAVLNMLGYNNLYYQQERAGWVTDSASRPVLLNHTRRALKAGQLTIHHTETYRQLRMFGFYGNRWQHPDGDYDDCVFSLGLAQQGRQSLLNAGALNEPLQVFVGDRQVT
jgi:hypothetical protein